MYKGPFKWWVQSVMPLVFDDSLSYYEVLAKLTKYIEGLTGDVQEIEKILGTIEGIEDVAQFTEFLEKIQAEIGDLANLSTQSKTNLVSAINEIALKADIAYYKPPTGIPESDLSQGVQDKLNRTVDATKYIINNRELKAAPSNNSPADLGLGTYSVPAGGIPWDTLSQDVQDRINAGGGGTGGTTDYTDLNNKPQINGHTLNAGNNTADSLGIGTYNKPSTGIPESDLSAEVQEKLNTSGGIADSETSFVATRDYEAGELIYINGVLYKTKYKILNGTNLIPGNNIEATDISNEIERINSDIEALQSGSGPDSWSLVTTVNNTSAQTPTRFFEYFNAIGGENYNFIVTPSQGMPAYTIEILKRDGTIAHTYRSTSPVDDQKRFTFTPDDTGEYYGRIYKNGVTDITNLKIELEYTQSQGISELWAQVNTASQLKPRVDAIETLVGDLNEDATDLKNAFDYGEIVGDSTIFESGSFTRGANDDNTKRLRTIGYVSPNIKSVYAINGYKFGVYCYNKSNNSFAGFVYTDGSVGTNTSKFTFRTSFTFDDPRYSAYNFRLLCASPDTSAEMTVAEANNYILVKNGAAAIVQNAIETIPVLAHGAYIKTDVGYGNIVSLLPITYHDYDCAISDCTEGDIFTVTGTGGGSGRLWAFIDSNNVLIPPTANSSISADSEIVIAPENSAKIIFNADSNLGYNFTKGNISGFSLKTKASLIETAEVHDFPSAIVKPTIVYKSAVNETPGVSDVKGSIFRSNNDFCIIYNENLDSNVKDLPSVSGTGTLAIKYKFFHYENGVESNVSYGEIARKGTEYTNWNGASMLLDGGCGIPSGISGIQYFASAYNGTKRYNGVNNYGLRPCACTVSVNSSGVTFGEIKELSLTINGDKGAFDISRIDPSYVDYYIYYTTTPPCKINDALWYWLQPVIHGIAVFRSSNGFDWELYRVVNTPYQPQCEVTCVHLRDNIVCFAARTRETNSNIFVGCLETPAGRIITQYKLQSITSRGYLTKDDKGILLFYNPTSYDACTCIRITANGSQLFFHEWFSIFKDCTWYVAPDPTLLTANYTKMLLVGNNGNVSSNRGLTFMELNMEASPKIIDNMSAGIE